MEALRPKNESKEFFERLHSFSLYDQLEKRDGSIFTVIKDEGGELITNPKEVDARLIKVLEDLHGVLQPSLAPQPSTESRTMRPEKYLTGCRRTRE